MAARVSPKVVLFLLRKGALMVTQSAPHFRFAVAAATIRAWFRCVC